MVDRCRRARAAAPSRVAVTHPANWGPYKRDLLRQAVAAGRASHDVTLLTEPEAAAVHYAATERVEPGSTVAVYDLGGGTFDAAVLRKTPTGFEMLGEPEGIERLGGIDFDEAVLAHVRDARSATRWPSSTRPTRPTSRPMVQLRAECIEAKEALSDDTEATIPVLLPGAHTEVRLTRTEFEAMIRPALVETVTTLRRAMESAGLRAEQIDAVLLVGGSSRIPLVSQLVSAELGRPVAIDVRRPTPSPSGRRCRSTAARPAQRPDRRASPPAQPAFRRPREPRPPPLPGPLPPQPPGPRRPRPGPQPRRPARGCRRRVAAGSRRRPRRGQNARPPSCREWPPINPVPRYAPRPAACRTCRGAPRAANQRRNAAGSRPPRRRSSACSRQRR